MDPAPTKDTKDPKDRFGTLVAGALGVVVVSCAGWVFWLGTVPRDLGHASSWGESFGGLNTLFSGLAFAGVVATLLLQRRELELQRKELRLTRRQLKRSAKAQEDAKEELKRAADSQRATQEAMMHQATLLRASVRASIQSAIAQAHAGLAEATFRHSGHSQDPGVGRAIGNLHAQITKLEEELRRLDKPDSTASGSGSALPAAS